MTGIEPAKCSLEGRCNNHYAPSALKYSEDGFEPPASAINIAVLPLNYSRIFSTPPWTRTKNLRIKSALLLTN